MASGLARSLVSSYTGIRFTVKRLALAMFVNRCGGLVAPFLAVYLRGVLEISAKQLGLLLAAHGVGSVIGSWMGGVLVARLGPKPILVASLASTALLLLTLAGATTSVALVINLGLLGVALAAFWPAQVYALIETSGGDPRRALALNRVAIGAAWLIAPIGGGLLLTYEPTWLFYVNAATCLASALVVLRLDLPGGQADAPHERASPAERPRRGWRLVAFAGLFALAYHQGDGPLQVYWREIPRLTEFEIGLLLATNGLIVVVAQIPLNGFASRFRSLRAAAIGVALIGLGLGILPWLPASGVACLLGFVLFTIGEMLWFPAIGGYVAEDVAPSLRARTLGALETAYSLGRIGAPMLSLLLYEAVGPDAAWHLLAALCAIATVGLLREGATAPRPAVPLPHPTVADRLLVSSALVTDTLARRHRVFFDSVVMVDGGGETRAGRARDLGRTGIGLEIDGSWPSAGERVDLTFALGDGPMTIRGLVKWTRPLGASTQLGVEFDPEQRLQAGLIDRYVWRVLDRQFANRDAALRVRYDEPLTLRLGAQVLDARAIDLSKNGMSLVCGQAAAVGERAVVRFMAMGSEPLEIAAHVAWCREEAASLHRLGLEFASVSDEAVASIDWILRRQVPRARGASRADLAPLPSRGTIPPRHEG